MTIPRSCLAAAAILLGLRLPAAAWEPVGADVDERVNELDHAWASLSHDATNDDIIQRSKQKKAPAWVARKAWREPGRGKDYGFGVGSGRSAKKPEKRIGEAESAARASLGEMMGLEKVAAAILDWYDDGGGRFYALAATEFAPETPAPAVEVPSKAAPAPPVPPPPSPAKVEAEEEAAVSLGDDDRRLRFFDHMGAAALARGDHAKCKEHYIEGLKLAQSLGSRGEARADLFAGMGYCLAAQGKTDYARKFLERALESKPSEKTRLRAEAKLKDLQAR